MIVTRYRFMSLMLIIGVSGCGERSDAPSHGGSSETATEDPGSTNSEATDEVTDLAAEVPSVEERYPVHGLVTGLQLSIRSGPSPDARRIGSLRLGARIRLRDRRHPSERCATGWYPVHPRGWVCAGQGIEMGTEPVDSTIAQVPPPANEPLPYAYQRVQQKMTAEYHRPPSAEEQRATWAYARRYLSLVEEDPAKAERLQQGELPGEPLRPSRVRRFLDRGFYVTTPVQDTPGESEFMRTVQGSYVWRARLARRTGSDFQGVLAPEGEALRLPIVWMRRTARPRRQRPRGDGTIRWAENTDLEVQERQTLVEGWLRRERHGERMMHVLEGERYFLSWFLSVAEPPPPEITNRFEFADDEVWVHVNLAEQNLVVYRGHLPIFATLISSGMDGHETPTGFFRIQRKLKTATMASLGPDAGEDRYRIEDVPWTQYFDGSIAIHGAFWHGRFGLERSHGCVNLSPTDARTVFELTGPTLPEGWHAMEANSDEAPGSRVIVTG